MSIGDVNSEARGSGARFNDGKPDLSLIPLCLLEGEARVWAFGAKKYSRNNWMKGMAWSTPLAALLRHLSAWQKGQDIDPESGEHHMDHVSCNARMLRLYADNYREGDDRPSAFFDISTQPADKTAKAIHDHKLAEDVLFDTHCGHEQPLAAESAYLASFSPNDLQIVALNDIGIGDVPHTRHSSANVLNAGHPWLHVTLHGPESRL